MRFPKTIYLLVLVLIASALACSLPGQATTPEAPAAPTDAGFAQPTQEQAQPAATQEQPAAPGETPAAPAAEAPAAGEPKPENKEVTLATTSGMVESGLINKIIQDFMTATGYEIKLEVGGSGRAFRLGEKYIADVLLVNEPGTEIEFVANGHGRERLPVMHSDYVIVGPAGDPAGIKGSPSAAEAMKKIAGAQAAYLTHKDGSEIKALENRLWKLAGVTPSGEWLLQSTEGPVGTVKDAFDNQAYTLAPRSLFLDTKNKTPGFNLEVLYEGDPELYDAYHVVTGNPDKSPKINYEGALAFANYLRSPEVQAYIASFSQDVYGQPIYFPDGDKQ